MDPAFLFPRSDVFFFLQLIFFSPYWERSIFLHSQPMMVHGSLPLVTASRGEEAPASRLFTWTQQACNTPSTARGSSRLWFPIATRPLHVNPQRQHQVFRSYDPGAEGLRNQARCGSAHGRGNAMDCTR
jgi:hypothetical protein